MSARHWDDEQLRQVHNWREQGASWQWIGAQTGEDGDVAKRRYSKSRHSGLLDRVLAGSVGVPVSTAPIATEPVGAERMEWTERGAVADLWSRSSRIRTLDALLVAAEVDLTRWYVKTHKIKKYDAFAKGPDGNILTEDLWSITVTLWAIPNAALIHSVVELAIAAMEAHSPVYAPVVYPAPTDSRHLLFLDPTDLHIGGLSWGEETGDDWDSDIASDMAIRAIRDLMSKASGFPVERVVIRLGGDLLHADTTSQGAGGLTTRGTVVETDTRSHKMFRTVRDVAVTMIDEVRLIAPVEVITDPGNHDELSMMHMGHVLDAWYRLDSAVTVAIDPARRKYRRYGSNLLGFTHGHAGKLARLPMLMATEAAADWAETETRDWHVGHFHARGEPIPLKETCGVRVMVNPSLAAEDGWAAGQGLRHRRACQAFVYHFEDGNVGIFSVTAAALVRAAKRAA